MVDKAINSKNYPVVTVDARGLACPMPLLKAKQALNAVKTDDVIELLADDPASMKDMKRFAELSVHRLLLAEADANFYRYHLQKQQA